MWNIRHLWVKMPYISASARTQTLLYHPAFEFSAYCWPFALRTLFVGWGKRAAVLELASRQATLRHNPFYCLLFFPLTRLTIKSLQHTLTVCSQASPFCTRSVDSAAFFSFFPLSKCFTMNPSRDKSESECMPCQPQISKRATWTHR